MWINCEVRKSPPNRLGEEVGAQWSAQTTYGTLAMSVLVFESEEKKQLVQRDGRETQNAVCALGREARRRGRQFELEGRQKEVGRGWKRQCMGRNDRWMWSDAGATPDNWHRNRERFHTFHSKLSFSFNLSVSHPGVALENTHFCHSYRSRRQCCQCFDVQEKARAGGAALRILYVHRWTICRRKKNRF